MKAGGYQVPVSGVMFDTDKLQACSVEDGFTVVHSNARRGYGLAGIGIKAGCYEWKVTFVMHQQKIKPFLKTPITLT